MAQCLDDNCSENQAKAFLFWSSPLFGIERSGNPAKTIWFWRFYLFRESKMSSRATEQCKFGFEYCQQELKAETLVLLAKP